jgi:hypothetical protein
VKNLPKQEEEKEVDLDSKKQVRGRKGKNKKLKDKYAEQSDEEREIRMKLMGAKDTKEMMRKKKENA